MAGGAEAERALEQAADARARFDVNAVVAHLSTAVRCFTAADDRRRAAMASVALGDVLANAIGNVTAGRAWFARARRLIEAEPDCVEQGWVAVATMGCEVDDPATLLASAELALDRARRFGDVNLETKALADGGLAHVQAGRIAIGMALLDEAMALACGPADNSDTAAKSVCSFFTACYVAADFQRAGAWTDLLRRQGLVGLAPGSPVFLSNHCDSVQAAMLLELGRWGEAEALLMRAKAEFEAVMPGPSWHPDLGLAELRLRQQRFTEAEELLIGKGQSLHALVPLAKLYLARGDHRLARSAAERGLRLTGADRPRGVELLGVLIDVELAADDLEAAQRLAEDLQTRTADLDSAVLRARGTGPRARVLAAAGDEGAAIAVLEDAIAALDPREVPWLWATLTLDLAGHREAASDGDGAALDARAAATALDGLDAAPATEQLAGWRRPDAPPEHLAPAVLRRGRTGWVATHAGASVRLPDTKGVRYLAELVAVPCVERHALDLVDRVEGVDPGGVDRRSLGDAGPALDGAPRQAYRRRIEALRDDIADQLASGRLEAAEATQDELDRLVAQLAQAFGLGGRDRRAASAAERARLNVTRAIRAATARLSDALPEAGASLDRSVRTGLFCAYEPPAEGTRWIVQSELNGRSTD